MLCLVKLIYSLWIQCNSHYILHIVLLYLVKLVYIYSLWMQCNSQVLPGSSVHLCIKIVQKNFGD